jgi:hypothetical protein
MSTRISLLSLLIALAAFLLGAFTVRPLGASPDNASGPGPKRIRQCGVTLSAPGAYVLERNLTSASPNTCIAIASRYVTLDLAGFAIIGTGDRSVETFRGIHVEPGLGFEGITVRNGSVQAFYDGVSLEGAHRGVVPHRLEARTQLGECECQLRLEVVRIGHGIR